MSPKIIKYGTAGVSRVQQFQFTEDSVNETSYAENSPWPDFAPMSMSPKQKAAIEAPQPSLLPSIDVAQLEKKAFEDGFRQGEKVGVENAERKMNGIMKRYSETILEIGKLKPALYAQAEREIVKLAIEIAKKIVHREIRDDPEIIQTLIKVALSHVTDKSAVTARINPIDYTYIHEQNVNLSQTEGRDITLVSDKSIERGGCMIETVCGDIDARIEEQFREVEHSFFKASK
jgi:flagellar biosynthesis/type III secretory pathway protein FliH